ncbi:exopolysaccharide biosynthesis predicted pyruvyl transferase EpsI [Variovorax boronicumulans]|uniref:hypothetical protein n=1 Tax=Variovorax boronicumulans TaxID=436515 RepID=UPI00277D2DE2|nr:hypothetical protein [Variovorax boronicumulans]MDQ0012018.1 exopolysaccharide biosynthesis predicted pyruvyl transferase EpsI [Variovorax boronicumulans]
MLPSSNTHELARRLPNSELVISHRLHAGVPAFFSNLINLAGVFIDIHLTPNKYDFHIKWKLNAKGGG